MKRQVPVVITVDVDPTPEASMEDKRRALERTRDLFGRYNIPGTFFFVANVAQDYNGQVAAMVKEGHEIGCHGLIHDAEEEYQRLPESIQRKNLVEATKILSEISRGPIRSFRGPRVKTSPTTQCILESLDYSVDSSVCSQRVDFISSNLINFGWIRAPRLPYHPDKKDAYKRGSQNILVIPVSAILIPFVSGTLFTFGLKFTQSLFRLLYQESLSNGKPIVYLMHSTEFAPKRFKREKNYPVLVEGFSFRRSKWLFEHDIEKRYTNHDKLFSYIQSFEKIQFMTMREYNDTYHHG